MPLCVSRTAVVTDLRLVTYQELATAWRLSPRTIQRWVSEDEKQGIRVPRFRRRVDRHRRVVFLRVAVAEALLARHLAGV